MSDADGMASTPCTDRSGDAGLDSARDSENLKAAYFASPIGGGFRAQLRRARKLTPAGGLRKAARIAVAASMLLAGRGEASS